jgi:hypothetical protein
VSHAVGDLLNTAQKPVAGDVESGLTEYDDAKLTAITDFISVVVATMLPTASIFVLYSVTNMLARLGVIMAFSVVFSATLSVFTRARKIEVFAATAA